MNKQITEPPLSLNLLAYRNLSQLKCIMLMMRFSSPCSGADGVRADQDVQGVRRQAGPLRGRDRQDTILPQQARPSGKDVRKSFDLKNISHT